MNKVLGMCNCPMPWCGEPGAEVREGARQTPYLMCDACGVMVRTNSRKGKAGLRALVTAPPAPAPKPEQKDTPPAPPAAAKRKGLGLGFA